MTKTFRSIAAAGMLASAAALPVQATASTVCAGGQAGCVLPVEGAAPMAPVETARGGASWVLPALLGIAAVVGGILLLTDDDDDDAISA